MEPEVNQSLNQKKIAFAQNPEMIEAVLAILREVTRIPKLVGDNEFETLRNAITLDAQSDVIVEFIKALDHIKGGGLVNTKS